MKLYRILGLLILVFFSCSEDHININAKGKITGTVVKKGDNSPMENVKITTSPSSSTVFTDENGNFTISSISEGTHSVQAKKDGFVSEFESANVIPEATINLVFELEVDSGNNTSPEKPILLLPENNATNTPLEVTLEWESLDQDEEDNLVYKLEIYNDQDSNVIIVEDITELNYTVSELMYNTKYFWQITVSDGENPEVLSAVYNFKTLEFPDNRTFFVRKINGNNVIFSINSQDVEYQLTSSNENSWRPRKAVGINRLAFLKSNGSQTHLFTMDLDGENQVQVTNSVSVNGFNLNEIDFEWKSNNTQLLYPSFDKLYQINANGGGLTQVYQTTNGHFVSEVDWCEQTEQIAIKTNNNLGYEAQIDIINTSGVVLKTVLQNVNGAVGGLDFNFEGTKLVYVYDDSQTENIQYRQLNANIYIYDLVLDTEANLSLFKTTGTNDLDPKFSPNESKLIFTNTSNDGVSQKKIFTVNVQSASERTQIIADGNMPEWK